MTGEPGGRPPTPAERDSIARMMTAAESPARAVHRCGSELRMHDYQLRLVCRYMRTCSGWLTIKQEPDWIPGIPIGRGRNGSLSSGWEAIVADCLSYITAADQDPRLCCRLEGNGPDGMHYGVDLIRELELEPLAALLGIGLGELREYLGGFALIGGKQ